MLPTPHTMYLYGQIHTRQLRAELLRRQLAARCANARSSWIHHHVKWLRARMVSGFARIPKGNVTRSVSATEAASRAIT